MVNITPAEAFTPKLLPLPHMEPDLGVNPLSWNLRSWSWNYGLGPDLELKHPEFDLNLRTDPNSDNDQYLDNLLAISCTVACIIVACWSCWMFVSLVFSSSSNCFVISKISSVFDCVFAKYTNYLNQIQIQIHRPRLIQIQVHLICICKFKYKYVFDPSPALMASWCYLIDILRLIKVEYLWC